MDNRPPNLLLITLFLVVTLFTAHQEKFLPQIAPLFWGVLIFGFFLSYWMALKVSTARLLSLILGIFIIEYIKETIGIRSGMWTYHGLANSYNFGVWAWVLGGLGVFWLAVRIVIRLVKKMCMDLPRRWNLLNPVLVVLCFAVIYLTLGPYRSGAGVWFWGLYAVLFLAALWTALRLDFPVFLGLLLTTVPVGFLSEYAGSVPNHIWTFTHNPDFPPAFLILGCWPLEILTQYGLSAFLARENLDQYTY